MQQAKPKKIRFYLRWIVGILLAQFILANISASIYAYKLTHFYDAPSNVVVSQNIFHKTWKLFTGPTLHKDTNEPEPLFQYETVQLKTSEGIPIDAWYSKTDSSTSCVILLHGYSSNKSFIEGEAAVFKQWGYSVLLFDLRGHGKSGGNATSFGMKETDELEKAFAFASQKGNINIILYGVSLGAGICLKAVADNKIHPKAIIADVPFENLHSHFRGRARILGFPSEPFALLTTFWAGVEKGYNGFQHDISNYAKKVTCPVIVEWGEEDPLVLRKEVESIFNKLGSKNKKLITYPGVGHGGFVQNDPITWEKEMQAFLQTIQ
jgi:uncharacterized protein